MRCPVLEGSNTLSNTLPFADLEFAGEDTILLPPPPIKGGSQLHINWHYNNFGNEDALRFVHYEHVYVAKLDDKSAQAVIVGDFQKNWLATMHSLQESLPIPPHSERFFSSLSTPFSESEAQLISQQMAT